jgi:tetratricopeptide (TPR) repeat protein
LDPLSLPINAFVGFMHMKAGRCHEAVAACRKAIELDPGSPFGHWMLARTLDACDQYQETVVESEMAARLSGDSQPYAAHLGYAQARSGDHAAARRVLSRLSELSKHKYISPYDLAVVCAALGDKDHAFTWLEEAYEQRIPRLTEITDPAFKTLRPDPRFRALARRIGLPESKSGDN